MITPIMENQMEKEVEHEMEIEIIEPLASGLGFEPCAPSMGTY